MSTRDDFTNKTKEILAKRVGYHCSNPSCRIITTGPHEKKEKSTNIGVAAHITAAASGGPRFDKSLTSEERKNIANGIWLCLPCSSIIDKDPDRFSTQLLNEWKDTSEEYARDIIDGNATYIPPLVLRTLEEQLSSQASLIESKDQQLKELKEKYISLNKSLNERSSSSPLIEKALFALNTGDFLRAETLLLEDIEENNKKNAKSYYDIGKIAELQVDYGKAIKHYTNAVNIDSADDQYLNSLARVLYLTANYEESVFYFKKILAIHIKQVGENHKDTARAYNNIGLIYHAVGNYDGAIIYCMKALKINLNILDSNHPSIAANYNTLAAAYQFQEEYDKAIVYSEKGLKIIISTLGDRHIDTATSYNNLGAIHYSNGNNDEAIKNHTKALELYILNQGEEHPNTGSSYNNLGTVNFTEGRIEKAKEYYTKALHIYTLKLGKNHPNTATIYSNLGHIYNIEKEYSKALEFYKKDLDINILVLGNHIHTCYSHSYVSEVYYKLEQYANAVEHCEKALQIAIDKLGTTHDDTKAIEKNLEMFKLC